MSNNKGDESAFGVAAGSGIRLRTAYRTLNYLEEIRAGDEVDSCRDPMRDPPLWTPATNIGDFAPDPAYPAHRIYRRPLRQNIQREPRPGDALTQSQPTKGNQ